MVDGETGGGDAQIERGIEMSKWSHLLRILVLMLGILLVVRGGGVVLKANASTGQISITGDIRGGIVGVSDITGAGWTKDSDDFSASGIFVDGTGRIYTADMYNGRIVRVNDMTGASWTTLGTLGSGVNQFSFPYGIYVDGASRIYVTDTGNDRIVRMNDMTGAGWTTPDLGAHPYGVSVH